MYRFLGHLFPGVKGIQWMSDQSAQDGEGLTLRFVFDGLVSPRRVNESVSKAVADTDHWLQPDGDGWQINLDAMRNDLDMLPDWGWMRGTIHLTASVETDQKQTFPPDTTALETTLEILLTPKTIESASESGFGTETTMRELSSEASRAILEVKERIVKEFSADNWQDIGLLTDSTDIVNGHGRLLRSLNFGDGDYGANVAEALIAIAKRDIINIDRMQSYIDEKLGDDSEYISTLPSQRKVTFAPSVFDVPDLDQRADLVAVMMPFTGFDNVYSAIKKACSDASLECLRADDIWDESTFIQDIVNLIFQARIVVCDFSTRNPNVFYETGIAHTLGKIVVPISQNLNDIPSDLQHHRALTYLNNAEGLRKLRNDLSKRFTTIINRL